MAAKEYVKKVIKNNTNASDWASWQVVKNNGRSVTNLLKSMGKTDQPDYVAESFEEAVKHYGLSESDLENRMKSHFSTAIICALLGLVAFGWAMYLLIAKLMYLSTIVALGLSLLMFSYAFREHFFYFKIKRKNLNCTVSEWLRSLIPVKRQK